MKKLIYGLAAIAFAAMMVACGSNNDPYALGVSKGNKSQMDSLSYAFGVSFAHDMNFNVPEMQFDWAVLADAAETSMLKKESYEEDTKNTEYLKVLEEFFTTKRPERMKAYLEGHPIDSTSQVPPQYQQEAALREFDIFISDEERKEVSEAYGYDFGARFREVRLPIQAYWLIQGIKDYTINGGSKILSDEAGNIIMTYQLNKMPKFNKEASEAWLAKVEKQKGVKKTESGLLYRIDREGDANAKPGEQDVVKVHYEGKLRDGAIFDSSYQRSNPAEFPLHGVIKGWTEGLQLVGKGGQITLWIPSELAYGPGNAGMIGPNEALEFKVELLDITPAAAPAATETEAEQAE